MVEGSAYDDRALACLEYSSIARGVRVLDALVKRAPVSLRHVGRHSGGKYLIVFDGSVAAVEESHEAALEVSGDVLLDHILLATVHPSLWDALDGELPEPTDDAVLMVETTVVATLLENLDFALKLVDSDVVDLHLASGISGKGYFALQGKLHDMQFTRDELLNRIPADQHVGTEIVPRPHEEMLVAFGHDDPFRR